MQRRVVVALERYARSGYGDVVRLAGTDQLRLRVGDWRVRFRHSIVVQRVIAGDEAGADHEREVRLIEVIVIRPRGSAYRD
jgi:ribulose bisphosphate carboxylase small subunit